MEVINAFEEKINGKCPVETTIKLLGGKYKSTILWALRDGALRYGELQERVSQASPKMLAEQLNEMKVTYSRKSAFLSGWVFPLIMNKN